VQGCANWAIVVESFTDQLPGLRCRPVIWRLGDPAVEGYARASDPRRDGQAADSDRAANQSGGVSGGLALAAAAPSPFRARRSSSSWPTATVVDAVTLLMYRMLFSLPLSSAWLVGRTRQTA
jgi:hypothetical protein